LRGARRALRTFGIQLAAVGVGLILSALVLVTIDVSPWEALTSLLEGAFGSQFALEQSALKAIPLALTGLAVALCLRMRLWNIGAEGQFHAGAIGASWVALTFSSLGGWGLLPLMIVAAMLTGAAWAALAAIPRALWGVNEIITTLLLNYVAILAVAYLVTGPWRSEASFNLPVSDAFPSSAVLPGIGDSALHFGVFFPLVAALVLFVLLNRSRWGYEVRMIGASPDAARLAGMSTVKNILVVMLTAGALAGVAGMVEVSTSFGRLRQGISPGYGYMAIVIAALAAANLGGTLVVAFLFGGFIVGSFALQALGVPQAFVLLLQGIILFCALAGSQLAGKSLTPRIRGVLRRRSPATGEEELSTP
jgi:ABC-type uncharacterized transport system permease subunit